MGKDQSKDGSGDSAQSSAPALPRVTRSKKRECPSAATSEAEDTQDTAVNNTAVDNPLPLSQQSHGQESTVVSSLAAEQSCLTKQDLATEDTPAETTDDSSNAGQTVKAVLDPDNDSKLESSEIPANKETKQSVKDTKEIAAEECSRSSETDQVKGGGSCALEQLDTKENSECNLEQNKETSEEEHSYAQTNNVQEVTEKVWAGLPARKKRRMGMCHLTDKERSHFLQAQKYENRQNDLGKGEEQMCKNAADLVAQEKFQSSPLLPLSGDCIPAGGVTEESKAEITLQPSHWGSNDRAQTEVHHATTTTTTTTSSSDGTSSVCEPGCSDGKSCTAREDVVPGLQPDDTKTDPLTDEQCLGSQEPLDPDRHTAESMAETPQEQVMDGRNVSAETEQGPAVRCHSSPMENGEMEDRESAALGVDIATLTREEKKEELICDVEDQADAGAPSTHMSTAGYSSDSIEPGGDAVSPSGSEKNNSGHPDSRPGASLDNPPAVHPGLGDTAFLFGPEYLDYISDSQLNTIALTEEEAMEIEEDVCPPDCPDATDLVCGLIRELSSLNRTVMATYRELENLRRSSKNSRSSIR